MKFRRNRAEARLTLAQALARYRAEWQHLASSRDSDRYAAVWQSELGGLCVDAIRPGQVEAYRARRLAEGKRPATVNRAVAFLRRVYNLLARDGLSDSNPVSGARVPKLKEDNLCTTYLRSEHQVQLLAAMTAENARRAEFAILTGLRSGEQWAMRPEHLDLAEGILAVPRTKSRRPRYLPLGARALELLRIQLAGLQAGNEWVWPGKDGGHYRADSANRMLKRACLAAGLPVLTWHKLRHTFGTRAARRSDIRTVQEALGHSSVTVTQRYTQVSAERLRGLMESG